jgi:hypothetical protein
MLVRRSNHHQRKRRRFRTCGNAMLIIDVENSICAGKRLIVPGDSRIGYACLRFHSLLIPPQRVRFATTGDEHLARCHVASGLHRASFIR